LETLKTRERLTAISQEELLVRRACMVLCSEKNNEGQESKGRMIAVAHRMHA
jgi:hypothetical protein